MGTLCVQRPEMKHLVVFSVLVVSSFGRQEVDGFFKESSYIPKKPREAVAAPRLGRDCSPPEIADCRGDTNYHPYPCDCHKYFQCVNNQLYSYDCDPKFLIFNPLTEQCEYAESAPPGLCQDTPDGSTTMPPTTTTIPTTTTVPNCWICPGCTCDATVDIDGFFKPYPGNCHWYYECVHNPDDPYCEWSSKGPYDCGDWAFNPEQSSCTWPELVPDCN